MNVKPSPKAEVPKTYSYHGVEEDMNLLTKHRVRGDSSRDHSGVPAE